jgi:hypothetical protein
MVGNTIPKAVIRMLDSSVSELTQNAHRPDPASDPMEEDNSKDIWAIRVRLFVRGFFCNIGSGGLL